MLATKYSEILPYVVQQLYLGSVHQKLLIATAHSLFQLLLESVSYAAIPIYLWLSKEILVAIHQTSIPGYIYIHSFFLPHNYYANQSNRKNAGPQVQISIPQLFLINLFETHAPNAKVKLLTTA